MVSKMVVIKNSTGLHARPATMVVKKANSFKSTVYIEFKGKNVNVKSLIGLLSLGVVKGDSLKVVVSGEDEVLALDEVSKLLETVED
jgi:phosphocarrier protein